MQLALNAGDVVVFRGDLVHAGATYEKRNVRLHVSLDVEDIAQSANSTHLMHFGMAF